MGQLCYSVKDSEQKKAKVTPIIILWYVKLYTHCVIFYCLLVKLPSEPCWLRVMGLNPTPEDMGIYSRSSMLSYVRRVTPVLRGLQAANSRQPKDLRC
jgi:hypothetical protein